MIPLALVDSIVTYSVIKRTVPHNGKITKKTGLHKGKNISKTILSQVAINPFLPTWHIFKKKTRIIHQAPSQKYEKLKY